MNQRLSFFSIDRGPAVARWFSMYSQFTQVGVYRGETITARSQRRTSPSIPTSSP
jgi:hypothetical protein